MTITRVPLNSMDPADWYAAAEGLERQPAVCRQHHRPTADRLRQVGFVLEHWQGPPDRRWLQLGWRSGWRRPSFVWDLVRFDPAKHRVNAGPLPAFQAYGAPRLTNPAEEERCRHDHRTAWKFYATAIMPWTLKKLVGDKGWLKYLMTFRGWPNATTFFGATVGRPEGLVRRACWTRGQACRFKVSRRTPGGAVEVEIQYTDPAWGDFVRMEPLKVTLGPNNEWPSYEPWGVRGLKVLRARDWVPA